MATARAANVDDLLASMTLEEKVVKKIVSTVEEVLREELSKIDEEERQRQQQEEEVDGEEMLCLDIEFYRTIRYKNIF